MRKPACSPGSRLRYRANIKLGNEQDKLLNLSYTEQEMTPALVTEKSQPLGNLTCNRSDLRVVDLFSGAGGMGLGFLMAGDQNRGYRIIQVAEKEPIYVRSLAKNHQYFASTSSRRFDDCHPRKFLPIDLATTGGRSLVKEAVDYAGGVDVLIGDPPCQGFSQSNRNSWSPENPFNKLVDTFVSCAVELSPKVILLENVQGILWTPKSSKNQKKAITVVDYVSKRLTESGYILFPAVVDAAWYGVPQHRNRFFLLALHKTLGYNLNDFGEWGAFPKPTHGYLGQFDYVSVKEAIEDLPEVENGENRLLQKYKEPSKSKLRANPFLAQMREMTHKGVIEGHIVSKQADYVIDRYKEIPEGENWQNIRHLMDNYADISRTHSNIYRRLKRCEPSITIGNYRKSMITHLTLSA